MTNSQRSDVIKLLDALVGDCDGGASEHEWRKCKHCSAVAVVQDRDPRANILLTVLRDHLKAAAALRKP